MKIPITESRLLSTDLNLTEILEIEGVLTFDPTKSVTITTNKNIVLTGKLVMKPNPDVVHLIKFTNIDENKFVGGGETVLATDIGLWANGAGQLDLVGSVVNDWERLGTDYAAMEKYAAAVGCNVRIEGIASGQAHMFIKSSMPQTIINVAFRWMGPRKDVSGDGIKELVTGRYACHFHHCENGSRGSIVEGCIARDCNNHVFVPHGSHGITMRNNIVYNVIETPFWYDFGHRTHDLNWESNLVVNVKYIARAQDIDSGGAPTFGAGGFVLGSGNGNKCNGNIVIGTSGSTVTSAAYLWPEVRNDSNNTLQLEDSWEFRDNTAINCPIGLGSWQNNPHHHIVWNTTIINCPTAIFHGAYSNDYNYKKGKIIGGTIVVRAASGTTNRVRFEEIEVDAAGLDHCVVIDEGPLTGAAPILFRNCKFINFTKKAILNQNPGPGVKKVDVIDCGLLPANIAVTSTKAGEIVRLQEGNKAWQIARSSTISIAPFAPSTWGTGTGLLAQYFSPDFKTKYLERIEPNINLFDLTHPSPHYAVPVKFGARWTGKIQAQVTGSHAFYCFAGGGVRLWVNNVLVIDKWAERYPGEQLSKLVNMEAGKLYDLKMEFFNVDDRSGCTLEWVSGIIKREFIPMSQLYPGEVKPPDPIPNKPPTADAGTDQLIGIGFTLFGKGMDTDGVIASYKWEQISGPAAVLTDPTWATTKVLPTGAGDYAFRLTVTDDKGASASDEVRVMVG